MFHGRGRGHPGGVRTRLIATICAAVVVCSSCTGDTKDVATPECGGELAGFNHRYAETAKVRLHYVIGGSGPAVLLLHGFPATWWTWRHIMPMLADSHTVIAPDLRGVGCSPLEPRRYDATELAGDVNELLRSLGVSTAAVVGHDTGGWVAYAYARQYRDDVGHLALSGAVIPGFGLERLLDFRVPRQGLPHLAFFAQPGVPELLIAGREKAYFANFVNSPAMERSGAIDHYARSYARPGRLTAALGQYRALYDDARDNLSGRGPPLTMPTLAVGGEGTTGPTVDSLRQVATTVDEFGIPGSGHYAHEERPEEFAHALREFLGSDPP